MGLGEVELVVWRGWRRCGEDGRGVVQTQSSCESTEIGKMREQRLVIFRGAELGTDVLM